MNDDQHGGQQPAAEPAGCPKVMWDGPDHIRCNQGADNGVCPLHGRFRHPQPADPDRPCLHTDMHLDADVQRLTASDDDPTVVAYIVELQVRCLACQERFRWVGVPAGLMPGRPACSPDEFTLHAPIRPSTADPDFGLGIPGFAIQYRDGER
ncbi:hypothetical protein JMF97_04140 [Micromonospora fiedleri]|uniref:Uncharacterized protein n=1 Tax=Micromonospora fiedleri TaxID=1157498 RepID=A0ABS1UKA4_9ACTN|nr:hypothetical protein [Micromonospora fiedleri]MBL6275350.1 hypothetical protein [Micromonospora fiedleri]